MPSIPLTSKFIPAFTFQEVLVNKDTGFPLASGIVTFYEDNQRTVLKDVYQITGNPGAYTVTALPNPLTLSSVGTFQDNSGNDIVPYFFPYDSAGQVSYYYVTIYSSSDGITPDVLQETREHVPYIAGDGGDSGLVSGFKNYIPDGQFLIHNDVPNIDDDIDLLTGEITEDITYIAPNGWTYERSSGSVATDTVNFVRIPITSIPVGNPRYAVRITCDVPSGLDTIKYLAVNFYDVNKFANDNNYTFSFSGKAISNPLALVIKCRKNFGTGGSTEEIINLGTIVLTATDQMFNVTFSLGANTGKTLGSANDDFCSFIISLPTNQSFDYQFTDFVLALGTQSLNTFPVTTNSEFSYETISGSLPTPDYEGMNYYLPRVLTAKGEIYDDSMIGEFYASGKDHVEDTELFCDGSSYDTDTFDSRTLIPYKRLWYKWDDSISPIYEGIAIYGNGTSFYLHSSIYSGSTPTNLITIETWGSVYAMHFADGVSVPTGFTFHEASVSPEIWNITTISPSSVPDGSYFTFQDANATKYYVWMKKSVSSVDPKPAGYTKRIICDFTSAISDIDVAYAIMVALNSKWLQLPDLRGEFLRGWADGSGNDPDRGSRTNRGDGVTGDFVGTKQGWQIQKHLHNITTQINQHPISGSDIIEFHTTLAQENYSTGETGGNQTNPINTAVMWVVRY